MHVYVHSEPPLNFLIYINIFYIEENTIEHAAKAYFTDRIVLFAILLYVIIGI